MTDPLVLSAGTLGTTDLVARIDAAERAGFSGLGLRPVDHERARAHGLSDAELRARLGDAGLAVVELQSVHGWAGDEQDVARAREIEEGCYRLAEALGATYLMVSSTRLGRPWPEAVRQFAEISARAADRGLQTSLEFQPWGPVPDARTAWDVVRSSGASNAGVLVDVWHHYRGAADDEQLRAIPARRINAVQLDDAAAQVVGSLLDDTRDRRVFPGEGSFDLTRFVRLLDELGVRAPYAVEVLSEQVRAMPIVEAARRAADTTRAVLAHARGTAGTG